MAKLTDSDTTRSSQQVLMAKQAGKLYDALFTSTLKDNADESWKRQGTGITVTTIQHHNLTPGQLTAIGEYRLEQYILAGLYEGRRATELDLTVDPNLMNLPGSTLHVLVGDSQNHLLCYASFEPAHIWDSSDHSTQPLTSNAQYMHEFQRPLFSVEFAFGRELYASHPEISKLPLAAVREMMRMVRNQAIRTPVSSVTPLEVIVAASHLLRNPLNQLRAIVGCASPELRKLSHRLQIPVAYAPHAIDHLREHSESLKADIWTSRALEQGRFWPLAISLVDIEANSDFFEALDTALNAANLKEVISACGQTLQYMTKTTPYYCYMPPRVNEQILQWVPYTNNRGHKPTSGPN